MQKRTKQLVAIILTVLLMGYLLAQPIKGLVNESDGAQADANEEASALTLEAVSQQAKQGLNASIIQEISDLEQRLTTVSGSDRAALLQELAVKWDDVNRTAPLGFIYEELAKLEPRADYWLKAGNAYRTTYVYLRDTALVKAFNAKAISAYREVLKIDSGNLDAKTGLGSAYVTGTDNPMDGIALLQEVVKADPLHVEANKSLGIFSMQSRQFDRAIDRFKTVVSQQPDAESYFYLATSYENIGLKKEAIEAFEKSRDLAADPTLTQFIDRKIDELSK